MAADWRLYFFYGRMKCPLLISNLTMHISHPELVEFTEVIEDTIEYFCDKEQVSGELAWTVLSCLCTAKLKEMKGELAPAK